MNMKLLIAALLCLPLSADATVIRNDHGGYILDYEQRVRTAPGPIVIDGVCNSACTMYLARRDACATPRAVFGFHQAFSDGRPNELGNAELWRYYPSGVRAWIARSGGLRFGRPIPASGAELGVPPCATQKHSRRR